MSKKELTKTSKLILYLAAFDDLVAPFLNIREMHRRLRFGSQGSLNATIYRLQKRGWIKFVDKNAKRFMKLTKKGELEALIAKAYLPISQKWDGKWRMIVFDIPEESKEQRNLLRELLKRNNFYGMQASVYISPHPLNREAIKYLQYSKLINYIRIIKVEEMDNDKDLKKRFGL